MGIINIRCTASTGSQLLGIAYAVQASQQYTYQNYTHILLVQSNIYPTSVYNTSWSLVSAWQRDVSSYYAYSYQQCHIDTNTGVFTLMSNFSTSNLDTSTTPMTTMFPGGFQYDPRTNAWSSFRTSPDYHWGDVSNSFALFTYPNTTLLFQANIALSDNITINLGMMQNDGNGSNTFVNVGSWKLDPSYYGYPTRLSVGKDAIYQFGSIVVDNRTAMFNSFLTRIPFIGPNGTMFNISTTVKDYSNEIMTAMPARFPINSYLTCSPAQTVTRFYKDTLYVLCETTTNSSPSGAMIFLYKDLENKNMSFSSGARTYFRVSNLFQVVSGSEDSGLWGYDCLASPEGISLNLETLGNQSGIPSQVNITDAFADFGYGDGQTSHVMEILAITLPIFFLLLISVLVWKYRRSLIKLRTQIWPRWKRMMKAKIIELASKIDDDDDGNVKGDRISADDNSKSRSNNDLSEDDSTINKIEEIPMSKIDMDECHKILVTPDMDLSDLEMTETTTTVTPVVMDVETGYMQDANLEYHPRPSIITSISAQSNLNSERITETLASSERSDNSQGSISQRFTTSEATLSASSTSRDAESYQHQEQQPISGGSKAASVDDEDAEDYVPPYSHATDISTLREPSSFLNTAIPSAPPLYADNNDSDPGPSLTEHGSVTV